MIIKDFFRKKKKKLDSKIIFMHLPKCGGASLKKAFAQLYDDKYFELSAHKTKRISEDYKECGENLQKLRVNLIHYIALSGKYDFITGHFQFDNILYKNTCSEYDFVTMIRDPVKRYISHYFYNRYKESQHYKIEVDIEAFVDSLYGRSLGDFYINSFTGPFQETTLENALNNASMFSLIGLLSDLNRFNDVFTDRYGVRLDIGRKNVNPLSKMDQDVILSDSILYKIEEICKRDIEFVKQLKLYC